MKGEGEGAPGDARRVAQGSCGHSSADGLNWSQSSGSSAGLASMMPGQGMERPHGQQGGCPQGEQAWAQMQVP